MTNYEKGKQYAKEENGYLAGNWPIPDDCGLRGNDEFEQGFDDYMEQLGDIL